MEQIHDTGLLAPPPDDLGVEKAFFQAITRLWLDPFRLVQLETGLGHDYLLLFWQTWSRCMGIRLPPLAVPDEGDGRFDHPLWDIIPFLYFQKQAHLLYARRVISALEAAGDASGWSRKERLQAEIASLSVINAASPSRFALTSPKGWQSIAASGGWSIWFEFNKLIQGQPRTGLLGIKLTDASTCVPGGNETYLCLGESETRLAYGSLDELIRSHHPEIDQGGFLEPCPSPAVVRLEMAGGEFCGNAARSAAAWVASQYFGSQQNKPLVRYERIEEKEDGSISFFVEMSGATRPLSASCKLLEEGIWVEVEMPVSKGNHTKHKIDLDGRLILADKVTMEGIAHVLIDKEELPFISEPHRRRHLLKAVENQLELACEPAIGLIWYDGASRLAIDPVVYVRKTDALVHESACGSGSLALAALCAPAGKTSLITVHQPRGTSIDCRLTKNKAGLTKKASIAGAVQFLDTFKVPLP